MQPRQYLVTLSCNNGATMYNVPLRYNNSIINILNISNKTILKIKQKKIIYLLSFMYSKYPSQFQYIETFPSICLGKFVNPCCRIICFYIFILSRIYVIWLFPKFVICTRFPLVETFTDDDTSLLLLQ